MKISGFTIIKNAVSNDYPIVEAITSILPVVDEMIVCIGDSTDNTEQLIRAIESSKIKIVHSFWDPSIRTGGSILAVETNKAFEHIATDSDWAFYIQADEVVHEKYHQGILNAAEKYVKDKSVDGLLFDYLHFYGTYDYVGDSRRWYHKEVRIIRNDKTISSFKDAQGFRRNGDKLFVKQIDAAIYHYGWVKSPQQMLQKQKNTVQFWSDQEERNAYVQAQSAFDFSDFDSLEKFKGTHPSVMHNRIHDKNWQVEIDVSQKKFTLKNRFLYWLEKKTGVRLFDFRNYRLK
ncbi:MAG: glycosyltransferase family 2 protein [Chitinophagaceae bacterium]|nr:glycosyltransferase family 2 protein [Chitinophagaceae bacterium]